MLKVGIISEFNLSNVNYGNRLQALALNMYLNSHFDEVMAVSLYFDDLNDSIRTKRKSILKKIMSKLNYEYNKITNKSSLVIDVKLRLEKFNEFSRKYTILPSHALTKQELLNSDYDIFISGSDVVWCQIDGVFIKNRFLDFETKKNFRKISYAASFGRDYIPKENTALVKRCIKDYDFVSVREKSSIEMLKKIGIDNVKHVLDPTLILGRTEWEKIEKSPKAKLPLEYIFVYMLGGSKEDRITITNIARNNNLSIITIPNAFGTKSDVDNDFGDFQLNDCSPDEWIWLIHHAKYIITDSFHGVAFSTIFEKPFIVTTRKTTCTEFNNRILDFLNTINQVDKMVDLKNIDMLGDLNWDYSSINKILKEKVTLSKNFLEKALEK
ncbi:polysaccharide pyruvyl transferase family protein [Ruminococcus sp.]